MPALAVKPDGTWLVASWYDPRDDSANSSIHLYGRWAYIDTTGGVTLNPEFRITTTNFPPVFSGTLPANQVNGHYDPAYPPGGVNLTWHYPEWPTDSTTFNTWRGHVGEYNGAYSDGPYVYLTWTDNRLLSSGTLYPRNQSDIRLVKITWPN